MVSDEHMSAYLLAHRISPLRVEQLIARPVDRGSGRIKWMAESTGHDDAFVQGWIACYVYVQAGKAVKSRYDSINAAHFRALMGSYDYGEVQIAELIRQAGGTAFGALADGDGEGAPMIFRMVLAKVANAAVDGKFFEELFRIAKGGQ